MKLDAPRMSRKAITRKIARVNEQLAAIAPGVRQEKKAA